MDWTSWSRAFALCYPHTIPSDFVRCFLLSRGILRLPQSDYFSCSIPGSGAGTEVALAADCSRASRHSDDGCSVCQNIPMIAKTLPRNQTKVIYWEGS